MEEWDGIGQRTGMFWQEVCSIAGLWGEGAGTNLLV